jgi:DNA-binding MarR family transcriptional regulator
VPFGPKNNSVGAGWLIVHNLIVRYIHQVDDVLELRGQVCFALHAASRAATAVYRPLLDELGLTYPQYLVLLVLWEASPRRVRDLADALQLDSGTLSPLLKRLEAGGLVTRARAEEDERVVRVALTDAGRALRTRAAAVPVALAEASGLSAAELAELRDTLVALTAALRSSAT